MVTFRQEFVLFRLLDTYSDLWNRLFYALNEAFRVMVPYPKDRTPWSLETLPYALAPFIPFYFMAYLVRRRNTYQMRLLLLPSIIMISVKVAYGYYWTEPSLNVFNWGQSA